MRNELATLLAWTAILLVMLAALAHACDLRTDCVDPNEAVTCPLCPLCPTVDNGYHQCAGTVCHVDATTTGRKQWTFTSDATDCPGVALPPPCPGDPPQHALGPACRIGVKLDTGDFVSLTTACVGAP